LPFTLHLTPTLHGASTQPIRGFTSVCEAVFFSKIVIDNLTKSINAGIASEMRQRSFLAAFVCRFLWLSFAFPPDFFKTFPQKLVCLAGVSLHRPLTIHY